MSKEFKPLTMTPDSELAEQLRKDMTAKRCVEALFQSAVEMAAAIGVTASFEVHDVDPDMDVDQERLSLALGRLATSGGAMLAGGGINPITQLRAQDPMRILRERRRKKGCKPDES